MAMRFPDKGRRALRAELEANQRLVPINYGSPMLEVKTAPRKLRRELDRLGQLPFIPRYGFRGARLDTPNKEVIRALILNATKGI